MSKINIYLEDFTNNELKQQLTSCFAGIREVDFINNVGNAHFAIFSYSNEIIGTNLLTVNNVLPDGANYDKYRKATNEKEGHLIASYMQARMKKIPCFFIGEFASVIALRLNNICYSLITEDSADSYYHHSSIAETAFHIVKYDIDDIAHDIHVPSNHNILIADSFSGCNTKYDVIAVNELEMVKSIYNPFTKTYKKLDSKIENVCIYIPFHQTMILIDDCTIKDSAIQSDIDQYFLDMFSILEERLMEKNNLKIIK